MHRLMQWLIVRHFTSTIPLFVFRLIHRHIGQCQVCHQHYERHLDWEALLPDAEARMGARMWRQAQAVATAPKRQAWAWGATLFATAAAASLLFLLLRPAQQAQQFTARGDDPGSASAVVLLSKDRQQANFTHVDKSVSTQAELAFRIYNKQRFVHLLVVVKDAASEIHYLYPAHRGSGGLQLARFSSGMLLPDAFSPQLTAGPARVVAVFSDAEILVDELEQALEENALERFEAKYSPRIRVQIVKLTARPAMQQDEVSP